MWCRASGDGGLTLGSALPSAGTREIEVSERGGGGGAVGGWGANEGVHHCENVTKHCNHFLDTHQPLFASVSSIVFSTEYCEYCVLCSQGTDRFY